MIVSLLVVYLGNFSFAFYFITAPLCSLNELPNFNKQIIVFGAIESTFSRYHQGHGQAVLRKKLPLKISSMQDVHVIIIIIVIIMIIPVDSFVANDAVDAIMHQVFISFIPVF